MAVSAILVVVFCALLHGANTSHWSSTSPPDGHVVYACAEDTINLTWAYVLTSADNVDEIKWTFSGRSTEVVATFFYSSFTPTKAFANRVSAVGNAGLSLRNVTIGDSGNFSVEVTVSSRSHSRVVLKSTIVLHVSGALITKDGRLHVSQTPGAVVAPGTNKFSIQLQCGAFLFLSQPPFNMEWVTPTGHVVNSTSYQDHDFQLLLQNPVQGGNYTCRVPLELARNVCFLGTNGRQAEATVFVDEVKARRLLSEKEDQRLQEQTGQTTPKLQQTTSRQHKPPEDAKTSHWRNTTFPDGHFINVCAGDTASIRWEYVKVGTDVVDDIKWVFSRHSVKLVAYYTLGDFYSTPAYNDRVTQVGNAGISLKRVTTGDSGNFSVEVTVFPSPSSHFELKRTVVLHVGSALVTEDGLLHASQTPGAVVRPGTNEIYIELLCGTFIFPSQPPFNMEWFTPSGHVVNSTYYHDRHFRLLLGTPVEGGNFTCRITSQLAENACLNGNDSRQMEATVYLDQIGIRLSFLEKEVQVLKGQLAQTNSNLTRLSQENERLKEQVAQTNSTLTQSIANLTQDLYQTNASLSGRLQTLEKRGRRQVAFHAVASKMHPKPPAFTPIIFSHVIYNHGNAYRGTTGYFTAPYPGIYYFIATTGGFNRNDWANYFLCVDNTTIGASFNYFNDNMIFSTLHGLLHLNPGQRVWIKGDGSMYRCCKFSMFTGFLLSHDS